MSSVTTKMAFDAFLIVLENFKDDFKSKNLSRSSSYRHCVNSIRELKKVQSLAFTIDSKQAFLF